MFLLLGIVSPQKKQISSMFENKRTDSFKVEIKKDQNAQMRLWVKLEVRG